MCHLEPEDEIYPSCSECGEEERILLVEGNTWECLVCEQEFGDGLDSDGSEFHEQDA